MNDNLKIPIDEYLPLRDVVFKTLRQAILMGELAPGERLMEIKLANRLGVSRTPIREAIRKLELEGLVVMVPRKGAEVARISQKGLHDVLEVRGALEELVVELACKRITTEEIRELKSNLKEFKVAIHEKDFALMANKDVEFHDIIYKATKNDKLIQILNNLREQIYRYRIEYIKDCHSHNILITEHQTLISNLSSHNITEAKKNIRSHLSNQMITVSRNIQTDTL